MFDSYARIASPSSIYGGDPGWPRDPSDTLSMNLPDHRIAASLGKAALKTHALQTLPRGPLTRPRARSVWSASDLSALSVRRGTASSSWSQCAPHLVWGLSMNRERSGGFWLENHIVLARELLQQALF